MASLSTGPRYRRVAIAIALSIGTIVFHSILCTLLSYSILDLISPHPRLNAGWNAKSMNTNQTKPNFNSSINSVPSNATLINIATSSNTTVPAATISKSSNSTQVPIMMGSPSSQPHSSTSEPVPPSSDIDDEA